MRTLIVDDEINICKILKKTIYRIHAHEIDTVHSGQEALKKIQERHYNVCFLDMKLGDVHGSQLIKPLRERGTAVIILTGHKDVESAIASTNNNVHKYLLKPINRAEIEDALTELIPQRYITVGDIQLDTKKRIVKMNGKEITVTPRERDILAALMSVSPDSMLSWIEICQRIDGLEDVDEEQAFTTLKTHTYRLQSKVGNLIIRERGAEQTRWGIAT